MLGHGRIEMPIRLLVFPIASLLPSAPYVSQKMGVVEVAMASVSTGLQGR